MIEEKIHVETSFSSLIKKNEELCGDKVAIRYCDQFCILVLADGLGSGVKANILSRKRSTRSPQRCRNVRSAASHTPHLPLFRFITTVRRI